LFFKTQTSRFIAARDYNQKMSVQMIDVLTPLDEVSPPITLERLSEVPPSPAEASSSAPEATSSPGLSPPPGLSSPLGHSLPTEVKEVTPEMRELINNVSLELDRIADKFASSEFMTKDQAFEIQYFTTMLPPGLQDKLDLHRMGDSEDESETHSITAKMDGNESSNESTKADSSLDESPKPDSNSDLDGSATASVFSDEDESNDEVPELPDLSREGLNARKLEKRQVKKIAATGATDARASTRIVFGDQGAKLAALAAQRAKCQYGYAGFTAWQPQSGAPAYNWHPGYGYVTW